MMQTPEILQLINNAISNIVALIETFGVYVFYLSMIIFVIWLIWEIGVVAREIIQKTE